QVCRLLLFFVFSSRRRHTRLVSDWSSDVCSSDLRSTFGGCRPANVDLGVAALCPPKLLESVPERCDQSLSFRTSLSIAHQHPNPSHSRSLLRPRHERPRCRCCGAAEQDDELAPSHRAVPPVLTPKDSICEEMRRCGSMRRAEGPF